MSDIRSPRLTSAVLSLLALVGFVVGCDRKEQAAAEQATAAEAPRAQLKPVTPGGGSSSDTAAPAVPPPAKTRGPFNVLYITIDSLRADMPWTGYERPIAPTLTEIAKSAVVYPRAYSIASYTAKSVATMLTGQYPSSLYRSGWFFAGYSDANLFVTELMQQAGVRTMSGHAHLYFDRGKNLNQGFDVWELVKGLTFDAQTDNHVTGAKLTDLAISFLKDPANTSGKFFAWFHYMDPHDQYVKHKETPDFGNNNRDRYDSEVHYTDQQVARLLAFAKEQPWWKDTVFVLSSDHGEAFGEHGMYKHAFEVWEVLTRVPLLFLLPEGKGRVIDERRSHIDLAPTFAELTGVKFPEGSAIKGRSLVPELFGAPAESHEPIILDLPEDSHNPHRRAVISGDYKLTVWGKGQLYRLYNLKDDPGESTDLAKTAPEKLAEMKQLFEQTWKDIPQVEPFGGMKLKSGRVANGPTAPPANPSASAAPSAAPAPQAPAPKAQ